MYNIIIIIIIIIRIYFPCGKMDRADLAVYLSPPRYKKNLKKQINIHTARNYTVKRITIQ